MNKQRADSRAAPAPMATAWGAVISMMLGVFALATAEFLPPSVLTPIASDLDISVGLAGQTVTATAALAFAGSLLIPSFTRRIDRRAVLVVAALFIALAVKPGRLPHYPWKSGGTPQREQLRRNLS